MTINHVIPDKKYFAVALPALEGIYKRELNYLVKDPKTGVEVETELEGIISYDQAELSDGLCLITYQMKAIKLVNALKLRFPTMNDKTNIKFLLLKKL